ncbi:MAG TPA: hypothetical protein VFX63_15130 [Pyrinomonadaceae bacterium]|nr:hypothetical protein [Pyrinomonadaceae bacterium]
MASSAPDYFLGVFTRLFEVNSSILEISKEISRILMPFSDGTLVAKERKLRV